MNYGLFYINYNSTSNTNTNIGCRNLFVFYVNDLYFMAQVIAHLLVEIDIKGAS